MDEEIREIMKEHYLEEDEAEEVQEIADNLDLDSDDAYDTWEAFN